MAAQRLTWTSHTSQCLNSARSCHMATHSSSTCLALYCTGRLSSSVLTWYDWSEPRLRELFDVVRIGLQLCHRWNAYWTKQLAQRDWLLCWLCRYIGCWFAGGGLRWSRWLHRRHPTSWPWAATGWWASCLMSMNLVMVVQNWLGSPGPGSVGWRPIRQTREERQTLEQNQTTTKRKKKRNKRSPQTLSFVRNFKSDRFLPKLWDRIVSAVAEPPIKWEVRTGRFAFPFAGVKLEVSKETMVVPPYMRVFFVCSKFDLVSSHVALYSALCVVDLGDVCFCN